MAADRYITCENEDGDKVTFGETRNSTFLLVDASGVYASNNDVRVAQNTMVDGAIYQSSVTKYRNIVLTVKDWKRSMPSSNGNDDNDVLYITGGYIRDSVLTITEARNRTHTGSEDYVEDRNLLNKVFKSGKVGKLTFEEAGEKRVIEYYVEYMRSTGKDGVRQHTISLICPDPFFYDPDDITVHLSQLIPDFEFIHEFIDEGEEFGHSMGIYENIYNESANENIGLTMAISGETDIVNPVITRMESSEYIGIGDENNPFTLGVGEQLIITTGVGNKHVYWVHNGTTEEINYCMTDGSTFIQLMRGNNNIGYDADSGKNSMAIDVTYRLQYARA